MLKDAKVVTSKFLQLRDRLDQEIRNNREYDDGNIFRGAGTNSTTANIYSIQIAFGELCELLHELVLQEE